MGGTERDEWAVYVGISATIFDRGSLQCSVSPGSGGSLSLDWTVKLKHPTAPRLRENWQWVQKLPRACILLWYCVYCFRFCWWYNTFFWNKELCLKWYFLLKFYGVVQSNSLYWVLGTMDVLLRCLIGGVVLVSRFPLGDMVTDVIWVWHVG